MKFGQSKSTSGFAGGDVIKTLAFLNGPATQFIVPQLRSLRETHVLRSDFPYRFGPYELSDESISFISTGFSPSVDARSTDEELHDFSLWTELETHSEDSDLNDSDNDGNGGGNNRNPDEPPGDSDGGGGIKSMLIVDVIGGNEAFDMNR